MLLVLVLLFGFIGYTLAGEFGAGVGLIVAIIFDHNINSADDSDKSKRT